MTCISPVLHKPVILSVICAVAHNQHGVVGPEGRALWWIVHALNKKKVSVRILVVHEHTLNTHSTCASETSNRSPRSNIPDALTSFGFGLCISSSDVIGCTVCFLNDLIGCTVCGRVFTSPFLYRWNDDKLALTPRATGPTVATAICKAFSSLCLTAV